jgi:hypothetical protein
MIRDNGRKLLRREKRDRNDGRVEPCFETEMLTGRTETVVVANKGFAAEGLVEQCGFFAAESDTFGAFEGHKG